MPLSPYPDMRSQRDMLARLALIARRQHGRVSRRQLLAAGVDSGQIDRWVVGGRLLSVHRGVYAVRHTAPTVFGNYMAAVLAGGEGAVLSHRAAAWSIRLLAGVPPRPEVTVPTTADRGRAGIVIHRVKALHVLDTATLDGLPITPVPRVLLDLAPRVSALQLGRVCHEAWIRHRVSQPQVEACIARDPRKPGVAKLRHALGADVTLSALEDGFLALLEAHGLPLPRTNIDHRGDVVDCQWPEHGLTVELMSYRYHATRRAFERDLARRRRSGHLAFSYGDVVERGLSTLAEMRPLLSSPGG